MITFVNVDLGLL